MRDQLQIWTPGLYFFWALRAKNFPGSYSFENPPKCLLPGYRWGGLLIPTQWYARYRILVWTLSDFSIDFAYHYRISVSTLSAYHYRISVPTLHTSIQILSGTQIFAYWFGDFSISLFGMWSNTSVFLTIQEEKTIFCLLDFFGEFFLSKSNFPVWFFCIFLPCPPQAKKIRVLDRKC